MTAQTTQDESAPAGIDPWRAAIAVMLATFMEVLDTSIAAVVLPYIAGSLSATNDEATWYAAETNQSAVAEIVDIRPKPQCARVSLDGSRPPNAPCNPPYGTALPKAEQRIQIDSPRHRTVGIPGQLWLGAKALLPSGQKNLLQIVGIHSPSSRSAMA
jgi:hypothetical protein